MKHDYIHGFDPEEQARLFRQARFLGSAIFQRLDLTPVRHLLEVGCGVGAMSEAILERYPNLYLTGVDVSASQLARARDHFRERPEFAGRCRFEQMDAAAMCFGPGDQFDGAFFCWVLEHVPDPVAVLVQTRKVLRPGAPVFITEVMNQSFFLSPSSPAIQRYWDLLNARQVRVGGDPAVGARLGNFLAGAGYSGVRTGVHLFHWDRREPEKRTAMIEYWTDLLLSAAPGLLASGEASAELVRELREEIARVKADPEAIFFYTFVQAWAHA
jgi:ubiquinone/menaquinone biosynthesis C-methylase UbiE